MSNTTAIIGRALRGGNARGSFLAAFDGQQQHHRRQRQPPVEPLAGVGAQIDVAMSFVNLATEDQSGPDLRAIYQLIRESYGF